MKTDWTHLDPLRVIDGTYKTRPGDRFGAFVVPVNSQMKLVIIATAAESHPDTPPETWWWEHASVHMEERQKNGQWRERTPNWKLMCLVKDLFWDEDEMVVQFHPARKDYVNNHSTTLHLWRNSRENFPRPPKMCV
jgi:hypothetical protein